MRRPAAILLLLLATATASAQGRIVTVSTGTDSPPPPLPVLPSFQLETIAIEWQRTYEGFQNGANVVAFIVRGNHVREVPRVTSVRALGQLISLTSTLEGNRSRRILLRADDLWLLEERF